MLQHKICSKCGIKKLLCDFRNKKATSDGKRPECKNCQDLYQKTYGQKNKKTISKKQKIYRQKNKLSIKKKQKQYYQNNLIKYKAYRKSRKKEHDEYMKKYRQENKSKIRQKEREWKRKNKEKLKLLRQKKYQNDIEYRLTLILRSRVKHALNGKLKNDTTKQLLGCTTAELKRYLENKFLDGMNWNNYGRYGWHIDHIIPCSSFDLSDQKQQKKCFHYSNLQPLWATDNLKKHSKIIY
jgi:hypothetical protein